MGPDIDLTKINEASAELSGQSDRAAALVGASLLDHQLECILRKYMIADPDVDDQFRRYGPLSSFSAKIDVAYLLGLIPRDIRRALDKVRDIRNQFAHSYQLREFSEQSIHDRICSLPGLSLIVARRKEWENTDEGRRSIERLGIGNPRRLWEIAMGDLYLRLDGYLQYPKQPSPLHNSYEGWTVVDEPSGDVSADHLT